MAVFSSQFFVTVLIFSGLVLNSYARVLSKPCTRGEFVAVVNSSRLFGLPVECHDACEVLAISRDSVAACSEGVHEGTGWTRCEASTPEVLILQDGSNKHLCVLLTTQQHTSCVTVNINGCYSHLKEGDNLRHRRYAEAVITNEEPANNQHRVHSWAIVVTSVVTIILLVLVSLLCVGGNKSSPPPSSSNVPVNATQQDSNQNAGNVNQTSNHLDSGNQKNLADQVQGVNNESATDQHLYQNVNVQIEEMNHNVAANQNQDQQPANQNQEQLIANQNEQLVNQNENLQADDPNQGQEVIQDHQGQQPANQDQAANRNMDQQPDAERAKVPYGIVTIHSDQSNTPPIDNNYAEVRNEANEDVQDITYDRVNNEDETNENGYSTVVRDQTTQQYPRRDRMYESVDEAFDRETEPSDTGINYTISYEYMLYQ